MERGGEECQPRKMMSECKMGLVCAGIERVNRKLILMCVFLCMCKLRAEFATSVTVAAKKNEDSRSSNIFF